VQGNSITVFREKKTKEDEERFQKQWEVVRFWQL
jgi:hypothetical protein